MGVKISNLPAIVTPALTDIFPVVQAGVTYKESFTQFSSLFATAGANTNITSLGGLTTPLSIAQGGTGSATGNPTFGSVTFSPTTQGIVGTTTNDNAAAGYVGQFITATVGPTALTTTVAANVASISLTAGDWDVFGVSQTTFAGNCTLYACGISAVSATLPAIYPSIQGPTMTSTNGMAPNTVRASLASTTTYYLVVQANFTVTADSFGLLSARRVR